MPQAEIAPLWGCSTVCVYLGRGHCCTLGPPCLYGAKISLHAIPPSVVGCSCTIQLCIWVFLAPFEFKVV